MAREGNVHGFTVAQYAIPTGASNAQLVWEFPGQVDSLIKLVSGGSCEIIGLNAGSTALPVAGKGFLMDSTYIKIEGPARYWLLATGATAVVHVLNGVTSGF